MQALTCAVDVFATALDLCGATAALPAHVVHDSVSLVPYLKSTTQTSLRKFAFSEEFTGNVWPKPNQNGHAMIRNDRYKLIRRMTSADEFYDLVSDPWETNNLLKGSLTTVQTQNHAALLNELARLRTPRAAFVPYGPGGCQGSKGVPVIAAQGTPALNSSYTIQLSNAAAGSIRLLDPKLAAELRRQLVVTEGFPTYGGMAGRDLDAIAQGLQEVVDESYLAYREASIRYVVERLDDASQRVACLETSERRTDAVVGAPTERQMLPGRRGVAVEPDLVGVFPRLGVTIGRGVEHLQLRLGRNLRSRNLPRLLGGAKEALHR